MVRKLPLSMLPDTLIEVPVYLVVLILPAVMLPVDEIVPPVNKLPPVILAVAEINPLVNKLPAVTLPLALNVVGVNVPIMLPP